jgi:hypothetical protein
MMAMAPSLPMSFQLGGDRGGEDVRRELKFQGERKVACDGKANGVELHLSGAGNGQRECRGANQNTEADDERANQLDRLTMHGDSLLFSRTTRIGKGGEIIRSLLMRRSTAAKVRDGAQFGRVSDVCELSETSGDGATSFRRW